jgi:uncharacterized repeat protein (TIGR03803 family)
MPRQEFPFVRLSAALLVAVLMLGGAVLTSAQTEAMLHIFKSSSVTDGFGPYSGLVADKSGALYGVTASGGTYAYGSVYKLSPPAEAGGAWKETVLYSFTGGLDGGDPLCSLYIDNTTHKIYGTAAGGGASGDGVVFALTPGGPGTETVLYNFSGPDGANPYAGLTYRNGVFYGTANGGHYNYGVVYALAPKSGGGWTEKVLHKFTSESDSAFPYGGLISDSSGALYGTTYNSPTGFAGTVYKLTPPVGGAGLWTFSTLYTFTGGADGGYPYDSLILDSSGALYGTTTGGGDLSCTPGLACGTVFKLTPPVGGIGPWTESVLYAFTGGIDGGQPESSLIFDSEGSLYGTTVAGGDLSCTPNPGYGCGTVFKLSPPSAPGGTWTESLLHSFKAGQDGYYPWDGLLLLNNVFYATTVDGGSTDAGTVFEITP